MADTKSVAMVAMVGVAAAMTVVFTVVMATYGASVSSDLRHVVAVLSATERRLALVEGNLAQLQTLAQSRQEALVLPKTRDQASLNGDRRVLERLNATEEKMQAALDVVKEVIGDMAPWKEEAAFTTSFFDLLNESLADMLNASERRLQDLEETFSEHGEELAETVRDYAHLLQSSMSAVQNAQDSLTAGLEEVDRRQNVTQARLDALEGSMTRQEGLLLSFVQTATATQETMQTRVLAEVDKLQTASWEWQTRLSGESNASLGQLQLLLSAVSSGATKMEQHMGLRQKQDEINDERQRRSAEMLGNATSVLFELRNLLGSPESSLDDRLLQMEEFILQVRNSSENHSQVIESGLRSLNASFMDFKLASERNHSRILQQLDRANTTPNAALGEPDEEASSGEVQTRGSCEGWKQLGFRQSGIYNLSLQDGLPDFEVFCDMQTDKEAWVVIQRRSNGSVDFYRDWQDYKEGFGSLHGEFWLGNDKIHRLTASGLTRVRFDLEDRAGVTRYAEYSSFEVAEEKLDFRLNISGYSGNAGDGMAYHDGYPFSTKDRGREAHCARSYTGAWWYRNCHHVNLNGHYYVSNPSPGSKGVNWLQWRGYDYSLKATEIKLREHQLRGD